MEVLYDRRKSEGKVYRTYQDPRTTARSPRKRHREHLPTVNVLYAFFETTVVGFELELPLGNIDGDKISFDFVLVWLFHHVPKPGNRPRTAPSESRSLRPAQTPDPRLVL